MAEHSAIEWTDATWNPVRGCTRISSGCGGPGRAGGCYAEVMAARFSKPGQWGHGFAEMVKRPDGSTAYRWTGKVALIGSQLDLPLRWRKPRRIFVNSTSDLFHEALPDEAIDRVFAVMALAPQHTFQVLTKRPERAREYMADADRRPIIALAMQGQLNELLLPFGQKCVMRIDRFALKKVWPLPNVWLGTSVEDQATADARIRYLLATPAAIRFASYEPALGPVDWRKFMWPVCARWPAEFKSPDEAIAAGAEVTYHRQALVGAWRTFLDQIIAGGESGPHARPAHPDWFRQTRDQCAAAGVAFFFKQWGAFAPEGRGCEKWLLRADGSHVAMPTPNGIGHHAPRDGDCFMYRVGKKAAGALLDGREHREFPEASP